MADPDIVARLRALHTATREDVLLDAIEALSARSLVPHHSTEGAEGMSPEARKAYEAAHPLHPDASVRVMFRAGLLFAAKVCRERAGDVLTRETQEARRCADAIESHAREP